MANQIIGRVKEQEVLEKIWLSASSELVAIYGRRRVGKTFLIREFFTPRGSFFELAGKKDASLSEQLQNFAESFSKTWYPGIPLAIPKSWREALALLTRELEKRPKQKQLLFFDELPWLSSGKSQFLQALDYFWNNTWSQMPHVKVILCGSAASWMLEKLIYAKGGLHNRITRILQLQPFHLKEVQEYLAARKIRLNEKQVLDLYMVIGGVPYYLNFVEGGKSIEQNLQEICFSETGILRTEFERLFQSLFRRAEFHLKIVREIARLRNGISRDDLLARLKLSSGGTFNNRLRELQAAGFIHSFIPYGKKKKQQHYRLIDEYSAFYLTWIDPIVNKGFSQTNYWKTCQHSPGWATWSGLAFESVCLKHLPQITAALKLDSIPCEIGNWRYIPKKGTKEMGAQVDLLFDRQDRAISLCEIKYSPNKYPVDKSLAYELNRKIEVFQQKTRTDKQLFVALITTMGIKKGAWADELVDHEVTLKDLFAF